MLQSYPIRIFESKLGDRPRSSKIVPDNTPLHHSRHVLNEIVGFTIKLSKLGKCILFWGIKITSLPPGLFGNGFRRQRSIRWSVPNRCKNLLGKGVSYN